MSRHDVSGTSVTILMADDDEEDREMTRGVGRDQLLDYIRREHEAEGVASVRMGTPVVEGDQVVGEFWTTMSKPGEIATLSVPLLARAITDAGFEAPVLAALANLIDGSLPVDEWVAVVRTTVPPPARWRAKVRRGFWRRLRDRIRRRQVSAGQQ
jgi:hypothetical protein